MFFSRLNNDISVLRYKKEYETSQANLRISKETSESLNGQVVSLYKLYSLKMNKCISKQETKVGPT